jgi:hypothetical protein
MRKSLLALSILALVNLLAVSITGATPARQDTPTGPDRTLDQQIPINIVFIGYRPSSINTADLLSQLPAESKPVVRYPQFYGLPGRDMNLHFSYSYNLTFAPRSFENDFFRYLRKIGTPGPLTEFQQGYNDQQKNVLDVAGPVLYIDAPSTEKWLHEKGQENLKINPERSYTVYLINWYARSDFRFHVYTKTDSPDPDTGYNFGVQRDSRKMIAWGGSYGREWFYDLSAGPESWTGNWNVDDADVDGDNVADYRMPPIWEYAANGYHPPSALSSDLGKVLRFAAINLLFTSSPLYDPLNTTPGNGGAKVIHTAMLEDDPNSSGLDWINNAEIKRQMRSFQPYYPWKVNVTDTKPIDAGAKRALGIWLNQINEADCWNDFGTTFAELFCYFDANLGTYVPAYPPQDYVGPIFAFNTASDTNGLLGYADDNWVDGKQTYIFAFDSPDLRNFGYGFTTTVIHEFGHHIGLSHPHDGYDSELGIDYEPVGDAFFAWSGDESATMMSYIDLTFSFGQFDRDNMYRWETAGYLSETADLLDAISGARSSRHGEQEDQLGDIRELTSKARRDFQRWRYDDAVKAAYSAYQKATDIAEKLGVSTPAAQARLRLAPQSVPKEVDYIRFPDQ